MNSNYDPQTVKKTLTAPSGKFTIFHLEKIQKLGLPDPARLPFSIRVLLECVLRNYDNYQVTFQDIERLSAWIAQAVLE